MRERKKQKKKLKRSPFRDKNRVKIGCVGLSVKIEIPNMTPYIRVLLVGLSEDVTLIS